MSIALEVAVRDLQAQVRALEDQVRHLTAEIDAIKQAPAIATDVPDVPRETNSRKEPPRFNHRR